MPLYCRNPFTKTHFPTTTELFQLKTAKTFPVVSVRVRRRVQDYGRLDDNKWTSRAIGVPKVNAKEKKVNEKTGKKEHHLWMKRDSAGSGQKALNLVRIVSKLPNEKEIIYGALDKWTAWETEFPLIAASKALGILRKRNQWLQIIQVFADMEELGVKPDEDTIRRVARAFKKLDQEDKQKQVLKKYERKWKYLHFNGERVRVRTTPAWDE